MVGTGKEQLDTQTAYTSAFVPTDTWNSRNEVDDDADEPVDADAAIAEAAADRGQASLQVFADGTTSNRESASSAVAAEGYLVWRNRECDQRHERPCDLSDTFGV